jgi:predicted aminopeptidase
MRWAGLAVVVSAALLAGCSHLGYYWQAAQGQRELLAKARPIEEVVADPATDPRLKLRLEKAREMRAFASRELGLPDNRSYTAYADLKRPAVVWNVFATPELSLRLKEWCFPVAGCVTYKGYFNEAAARKEAEALRADGWDVHVGLVPAYSTLGWFDDPLLSTFIWYPEAELARLIFHELAHQLLYVKGDTTFNESFASAVEEFGVERWLAQHPDPKLRADYDVFNARKRDFQALLAQYRGRLEAAYASGSDAEKRARKTQVFADLQADYQRMKAERWGGFAGYDRWFGQGLTNAHLASVGSYTQWLPAFRALLKREGNDMPRFYAAVQQLARMDKPQREQALAALAPMTPGVALQ